LYDSEDGIDICKNINIPRFLLPIARRMMRKQGYAQGVGRHTKGEVHQVMNEDLKALSMFIGKIINIEYIRVLEDVTLYDVISFSQQV
jgi:hypothetical protein